MNKKIKLILFLLGVLVAIVAAIAYLNTVDIAVLNPKGEVADKERGLIILAISLSAIVVIPVFVMLGIFSWRYREGNKKASYRPDWDNNKILETIWWGVPCVIILVLAVVTWQTSHELDPFKALASSRKPVSVQVVALQWKWLFIYPDQKIASVNLVQLPKDTPINLTITADAPMNAFWIPHLGSQVYAMSGMSSQLHLIANETGDYKGSSSNISGKGFADMAFTARVANQNEFEAWVKNVKKSGADLDQAAYDTLAKPGSMKDPSYYVLRDSGLYDSIIMKYMMPKSQTNDTEMDHSTAHAEDHNHMMDMPGMEGM